MEGGQPRAGAEDQEPRAYVDLYWIPLGAGAHVVRLSGKLYETIAARIQRRPRYDLYHSALIAQLPEGRFVIEQTPVIHRRGVERGVTIEGPVGRGSPDDFGSSGMKSGDGETASSRTSRTPSGSPCG